MNFQELATMIPMLKDIALYQTSQVLNLSSDCHAIVIVKYGHITITLKNKSRMICTEGFALNRDQGPFCIEVPKTKSAEYGIIFYRLLPENHEWTLSGPLFSVSKEKIDYMFDEILRTRISNSNRYDEDPTVQLLRERLMLERILFIYLLESSFKKDERTTMAVIGETVSYLSEHYMLDIKLKQLAERAGISVGHYTVLFKKHTGMTVKAYQLKLRIDKAKQYLIQSDLPAKEIGSRVGFSDYFHFSRSFKKEVGCSPTFFRKDNK